MGVNVVGENLICDVILSGGDLFILYEMLFLKVVFVIVFVVIVGVEIVMLEGVVGLFMEDIELEVLDVVINECLCNCLVLLFDVCDL